MTLDLSDKPRQFEQIPEGTYEVVVTSAVEDTTKNGHRNYQVKYKILYGKFKNRLLTDKFFLWSEKEAGQNFAKRQLKELLLAVGSATTQFKEIGDMGKELLDKTLEVVVAHREYNGRMYENVVKRNVVNNTAPKGTFVPAETKVEGVKTADGRPAFKMGQETIPWESTPTADPKYADDNIPF